MKRTLCICALIAGTAFSSFPGISYAHVEIIPPAQDIGEWKLKAGTTASGNPACLIDARVGTNNDFNLVTTNGNVEMLLMGTTYVLNFRSGFQAIANFDDNSRIYLDARLSGSQVTIGIPADRVKEFMHEFTTAKVLRVNLAEPMNQTWIVQLNKAAPAFGELDRCVQALKITNLPVPFTQSPHAPTDDHMTNAVIPN
ncbi:hypothetical protein KMAL_28440 [Novacetimonas maltaceti]|uniref:DUF4488 domain-containing protein n=2 Tax=Novacetimonas maltaceti TaxID=1203393 RepID=A0A2S3VY48_9PROT|nr:hypothetical protein KMAL_28440 [Novacetimonas maltaceti]